MTIEPEAPAQPVTLEAIAQALAEDLTSVAAAYQRAGEVREQAEQWCAENDTTLDVAEARISELLRDIRAQAPEPLTAEQRIRQTADELDIRGRARARFLESRN